LLRLGYYIQEKALRLNVHGSIALDFRTTSLARIWWRI